MVTLDISQEVSNVASNVPAQVTSTLNSPTFDQRLIRTRVAIQDGQTVGLAGLIRDSDSQGNSSARRVAGGSLTRRLPQFRA